MALQDSPVIIAIWEWLKENYIQLIIAVVVVIISLVILIIVSRYIRRLANKNKLTENYAKLLIRIFRFIFFLVVIFSILVAFDITVGAITGAIALLGGTIVGFAAINTIGNALAGLIVMVNKPIHIGDRILFKEKYADVIAIELIYTHLKTLDGAIIYVPNLELVQMEIVNYGKGDVRRSISITAGFDIDSKVVEQMLLESLKGIEAISKNNPPSVSLTEFQNFAVEYTIYYTINDITKIYKSESNIRKNILEKAKKFGIDLRTPNLTQMLPND